jgi:hypothetical protein
VTSVAVREAWFGSAAERVGDRVPNTAHVTDRVGNWGHVMRAWLAANLAGHTPLLPDAEQMREGGEIIERIELDRPGFSYALGGPQGHSLFIVGQYGAASTRSMRSSPSELDRLSASTSPRRRRAVSSSGSEPAFD